MNNFVLLIACFLLGIALRAGKRLPDNAPSVLNGFLINVSLPALTLTTVHKLDLEPQLFFAALMAWVLFSLGVAFFWIAGRALDLSRSTIGALMLVGGFGNTAFIGLPMIELWYGPEFMGIGIVADQLGSYFALSTLGILVAGICSARARPTLLGVAKKVFTFAPFVSLLVALALTPVAYPAWFDALLERLGATVVPLALVSVGFQLRLSQIRGRLRLLSLGLAYKLLVGPALVMLLFIGLLDQRGSVIQIAVFEAAMGPMIGAAVVALDHELDPSLVTLMVGIGIPLSFVTLPGWWWALGPFS